jgi:hypothetical protein
MIQSSLRHSRSGFSILIALGTIGVLLIIVIGLASVYLRELKLSRASYDDIVASAGAEGAFEYAMLKIRNHREGFADSMTTDDRDGKMLELTTERSKGMKSSYKITANSLNYTFVVSSGAHLIIPLFTANESFIDGSSSSKKPFYNTSVINTSNIVVNWFTDMPWTIVAMSGSTSLGITGTGNINSSTKWIIRVRWTDCFNWDWSRGTLDVSWNCVVTAFTHPDGTITQGESLEYFYDLSGKVSDFLAGNGTIIFNPSDTPLIQIKPNVSSPYLMIYNSTSSPQSISISSTTPFTLPNLMVEASAEKNKSLQVFRFIEDKSRYYDALKYGAYNNTP